MLFKLFYNGVDVAFKLLILSIELVEMLFKLFYNVVDVAFKLLIFNVELLDNEYKRVFCAYTDRLGAFVIAL
jgi:hypothetical protein